MAQIAAPTIELLNIFSNDRHMILYRPEWRKITGSVSATILLQQIFYRWDKHNREPFYKFWEPCSHALCRDGDTWTQEFGFSKFEFDLLGYFDINIETQRTDSDTLTVLAVNDSWEVVGRGIIQMNNRGGS